MQQPEVCRLQEAAVRRQFAVRVPRSLDTATSHFRTSGVRVTVAGTHRSTRPARRQPCRVLQGALDPATRPQDRARSRWPSAHCPRALASSSAWRRHATGPFWFRAARRSCQVGPLARRTGAVPARWRAASKTLRCLRISRPGRPCCRRPNRSTRARRRRPDLSPDRHRPSEFHPRPVRRAGPPSSGCRERSCRPPGPGPH